MSDFVSIRSGSATVRIPQFRGLCQYGDGVGSDPRCAVESENALTGEGVLKPMAACTYLEGDLPSPIETLARLHRRYYTADHEKDVLIAAAGGQLYWRLPSAEGWHLIPLPPTLLGHRYQSSRFSCVSYEINPEGSEAPVDVLLLSNAQDGMLCLRGDDLTVSQVETPRAFGVIARHAERIWGGAIEGDPDMLVYSAPYNPFDWTQNDAIPEDGAGDVLQPSWDGDSFTALLSFGSQLLAFKKTRVWRVIGTNPGEYAFKEQFGGGARYERTVQAEGMRVLMLGSDGLLQYDGENVSPYRQAMCRTVFDRMNQDALGKACACVHRGVYYCALPLDDSPVNNAVLIYDPTEDTWLLRTDVQVESFLSTENSLFFTSASAPGRIGLWQENGPSVPMRWVSPWQDLGLKNIVKGSFQVYMTVECDQPAQLCVSIETEKKKKTKTVVFPASSAHARQKRLSFGGSGRRFRLMIESDTAVPWRIAGGVQIEMETDRDG